MHDDLCTYISVCVDIYIRICIIFENIRYYKRNRVWTRVYAEAKFQSICRSEYDSEFTDKLCIVHRLDNVFAWWIILIGTYTNLSNLSCPHFRSVYNQLSFNIFFARIHIHSRYELHRLINEFNCNQDSAITDAFMFIRRIHENKSIN